MPASDRITIKSRPGNLRHRRTPVFQRISRTRYWQYSLTGITLPCLGHVHPVARPSPRSQPTILPVLPKTLRASKIRHCDLPTPHCELFVCHCVDHLCHCVNHLPHCEAHRLLCESFVYHCEPLVRHCERLRLLCESFGLHCAIPMPHCDALRTHCEALRSLCEAHGLLCEPLRSLCDNRRSHRAPIHPACILYCSFRLAFKICRYHETPFVNVMKADLSIAFFEIKRPMAARRLFMTVTVPMLFAP